MDTVRQVTAINNSAFWGCTGLTSVTLPNTITWIGNYTFYECSGLKSITLPSDSLRAIGKYCFYKSGLEEITIPECVYSIEERAFNCCNNLKTAHYNAEYGNYESDTCTMFDSCIVSSITIGNNVKYIPLNFAAGTNISSITLPSGLESIARVALKL